MWRATKDRGFRLIVRSLAAGRNKVCGPAAALRSVERLAGYGRRGSEFVHVPAPVGSCSLGLRALPGTDASHSRLRGGQLIAGSKADGPV